MDIANAIEQYVRADIGKPGVVTDFLVVAEVADIERDLRFVVVIPKDRAPWRYGGMLAMAQDHIGHQFLGVLHPDDDDEDDLGFPLA